MSLALTSRKVALLAPWLRNPLWAAARAVPSLDLRFADSKSLVDATTGQNLVTFTRASEGTFVNSQGQIQTAAINAPRFDHNPTTGESLGLLVEEQRTNLLLRSEEFATTWFTAAGSIASDAGQAPNGTTTADRITPANGAANAQIVQATTITSGATVTGSLYIKSSGFDRIQIVLLAGNNTTPYGSAIFNASTGAIDIAAAASNGGTNVSAAITPVGNGWYRASVTVTYPAVTSAGMRLFVTNSDASNGDGTKGVLVWGAQLEAGSFPTSYIPTTTSAATRSADVASISGSNLTSWFNASFGTVFCGTNALRNASGVIYGFGDTFDNTLYATPGSSNNVIVRSGGASTAILTAPISTSGVSRSAVAYQLDSFAAASDGGTVSTDTSGAVPVSPVRFKIGSSAWDAGASNIPNGHISRLTYWPQRLGNEVLQRITQ